MATEHDQSLEVQKQCGSTQWSGASTTQGTWGCQRGQHLLRSPFGMDPGWEAASWPHLLLILTLFREKRTYHNPEKNTRYMHVNYVVLTSRGSVILHLRFLCFW